MSERTTHLEVVLHEGIGKPWAEWELFWKEEDEPRLIAIGTGPSLEGCIDKALKALYEVSS